MEERNNTAIAAAFLLIAGGVLGAGVALLFAPQSGARTRKDLLRYARKARRRADDVADDASAAVSKLVEQLEEKAKDGVQAGAEVTGSARKDLIRLIEEGASTLEKFRTMLKRT